MKTEKTAYERWLIEKARELPENEQAIVIAHRLVMDCTEQNPQAFNIVARVQESDWTIETFIKAAELLLEGCEENK